jgi:hypothetical protein
MRTNSTRAVESQEPERKRPYQSPRVEETGSFERLMLECSHQPKTPCEDTNPSS